MDTYPLAEEFSDEWDERGAVFWKSKFREGEIGRLEAPGQWADAVFAWSVDALGGYLGSSEVVRDEGLARPVSVKASGQVVVVLPSSSAQ